jgi:hypothetical protein
VLSETALLAVVINRQRPFQFSSTSGISRVSLVTNTAKLISHGLSIIDHYRPSGWYWFIGLIYNVIRFWHELLTLCPLVEQELLTLPKNMSSHPVLSGVRVTRSLVLCVCFVDRCLSFCTFFLAIVLSVLLRYTDSDTLHCLLNLPNLCPRISGVWTTSPCINWNGLCLFITTARSAVSLNTGTS